MPILSPEYSKSKGATHSPSNQLNIGTFLCIHKLLRILPSFVYDEHNSFNSDHCNNVLYDDMCKWFIFQWKIGRKREKKTQAKMLQTFSERTWRMNTIYLLSRPIDVALWLQKYPILFKYWSKFQPNPLDPFAKMWATHSWHFYLLFERYIVQDSTDGFLFFLYSPLIYAFLVVKWKWRPWILFPFGLLLEMIEP